MKIDVNKAIEQIADGLGIAVSELYPVLYKQAMISAGMYILWILFFVGITVAYFKGIKFIKKKQRESNSYDWDWDEGGPIAFLFIGGLVVLIGLFTIPFNIEGTITALFNTEYFMIDKVLSKINGN